ncbi:MAG: alpha-amylase [Proteobacteria bacterium]|nr:alpha-amylase [Pseudomonadota bacterium]
MKTPFANDILQQALPRSVQADVLLPRRQRYYPSPADWRDEVLYFLLADRFSDGQESNRPLLDRSNRAAARPRGSDGQNWRWDRWAESGAFRWQGGTLKGIESKLEYLQTLGITTIWLSPVFRQRGHLDTFHGYGVQHFLDVDPHFGTRADLADLVAAAHQHGIRIILDIIFNHSGFNWVYPGGVETPAFKPFPQRYDFGSWLGQTGQPIGTTISTANEGVWPQELQAPDCYSRAGLGDLGGGSLDDPHAEHKRTDFFTLRDFDLDCTGVLSHLAECYKYWIALTDCDGFRIDTLKHVSFEQARNFCGAIKEFTANLGKANFLLAGEIAGGDFAEDRYLDVLGRNLDAALDIGGMRPTLHNVAKGLLPAAAYFSGFDPGKAEMGSHRNLGQRHVSILDDHDQVSGEKIRFSSEAASDQQAAAAVAIQLFTLGIPCIYYGTEQSFTGPEASERQFLPGYKSGDHADRYLREAMFGPLHPKRSGLAGLAAGINGEDPDLPGFGAFGTAGAHCFQSDFPTYRRIAALAALRKQFPVLRQGRQYQRPISNFGAPFELSAAGEIIAWSRILDDEEALCIVNPHGYEMRGGNVIVDASLSPPGSELTVVMNTRQTVAESTAGITHPVNSRLRVKQMDDGTAYVEIRKVPPSEVLVLVNHP